MKTLVAFALAALATAPAFAQSKEYQGPARAPAPDITDQIIVKWRDAGATVAKSATVRASKATSTAGVALQHKRQAFGRTEVYKLDRAMAKGELQTVLDRLNADPDVEYAVADKRRFAHALPSDPMFDNQWYLQSAQYAATRTDQAWDVTTGSDTTIVAVLDTGVRPEHPDLTGKLLAGYDFISEPAIAGDGDGRDPNPIDNGDFLLAADRTGILAGCNINSTSSWHGTRVSSLIAANTDEGAGIAGQSWSARILPIRVLGKCGGSDSDIIDAMAWAAGLPVPGMADLNPTPAQIINLSLGGDGACTANYQSVLRDITAAGVLVVASVGNDGTAVGTPANCNNVLGVGGVRHTGTKVGYSNLGPGTDIAAPAGNCVNTTVRRPINPGDPDLPCVYSILAAIDMGATTPVGPGYTNQYELANYGTSFSSPLVAGTVALMHAVNPRLRPAQFSAVIQGTSTPFPTTASDPNAGICRPPSTGVQGGECICTTSTCGAGILNTAAAVNALSGPFGVIQAPATFSMNTNVTIDGTTSFDTSGGQVASYQWSLLNVTGAMPTIASATSANTTLQVDGTSTFTLRLRVTDASGATDDTDLTMATAAPPPAATPIGSRGGGGGAFDWWLLLLGLLPLALPGPRKRRPARVRGRIPRPSPLAEWQHASVSAVRSDRRRRRQQFPQ